MIQTPESVKLRTSSFGGAFKSSNVKPMEEDT
jgi:hypothetical protein